MNDEKLPPPRMTRPANVNRPPEIRARPGGRPVMSQESKFIGYLVLGFGVVAVIAVVLLFFSQRNDKPSSTLSSTQQAQPNASPTQTEPKKGFGEIAKDLASGFLPAPETTAPKPIVKKDLYFKRQPDISVADIEGDWQSTIGNSAAALKMSKGVYQIILASPDSYGYRTYSSGTYTKTEDIIMLTPHNDWAKPQSPPNEKIEYQSLTSAEFPVIAAIKDGKMLWQNPPPDEKRVLVPNALVLVPTNELPYIVWQRMK